VIGLLFAALLAAAPGGKRHRLRGGEAPARQRAVEPAPVVAPMDAGLPAQMDAGVPVDELEADRAARPPPGTPGATYEASARQPYLQAALLAVREARPAVLEQAYSYLSAMERGACAAGNNERLHSDCLITAARRFCRTGGKPEGSRCPLFMDVIASNVMAERELISEEQRYAMMQKTKDYRQELLRQMKRLQGSLAVELGLSAGVQGASEAGEIDRYCLATADKSRLSWQSCAAALVWFIGRRS
jgi:hypothetical protein